MSNIWKYFIKFADEAKCKICAKKIGKKDGSTRSMWKHLESLHNEEFVCLKGNGAQKKENESIRSFIVPKKDATIEAEEQIARIMIRQNNSFLFFEDKDLRALYAKANPNLKALGSWMHFRRVVIPRMADELCAKIRSGVSSHFYAITSDGWSQPTHSPQLQSITIHWVDEKCFRNDMVLAAIPMGGLRHTGENLAAKITETLSKSGLALEKMICCVRDDASNMRMATNIMETESFQCCAHFLHLVVTEVVKAELSQIVEKVREWTKECRKTRTKEVFRRHQEQMNTPKKLLIMPVSTRWNSVFSMLKAFLEQKRALLSMQLEREHNIAGLLPKRPRLIGDTNTIPSSLPPVNKNDFDLLRNVCPILQIFDTETKKFSHEKSTCSAILPTLKKINNFLVEVKVPPVLEPFISKLINSISDRVKKLLGNQFLLISTLLDPRFAYDESIFTKLNWSIIEDDLIEYAKRVLKENEANSDANDFQSLAFLDEADQNLQEENSDEDINYDIWKPKSPGTVSVPSTLSGENKADLKARLQLQLATFKAIGRPSVDTDIFEWWASNGLQLPDLVVLARIVHSVPATSVSSERLFSKAGLIYSNTLRNRLSGELVEKILIIKANLDQLLLEPNTKLEEEDDEAMDEEVIVDENHFEDFGE